MSVVTNVVLLVEAWQHDHRVAVINRWLTTQRDEGRSWGELTKVEPASVGGTKALEVDAYLGAFNHLAVDDFRAAVGTAGWEAGDSFVLVMKTEEGFWTIDKEAA